MQITQLQLYQFRNYSALTLSGIGKITLILGPNAVGKTNLLEGIDLVVRCHSFRNTPTDQLVYEYASSPQARVAATISGETRTLLMEMTIDQGKRTYSMNGKPRKLRDPQKTLPVVVFTPDDLTFVKGSQSGRRNTVDALGSQLSVQHKIVRRDYENVLRHKNALLKEELPDRVLIDSVNELIVTCGAQLTFFRAGLLHRLEPYLLERYQELSSSKETLRCVYVPSWEVENDAYWSSESQHQVLARDDYRQLTRQVLDEHIDDELQKHRALFGPQADRILFLLNDKPAEDFASQGQQRTLVLAWKLAEIDIISAVLQTSPLLLLDDVMSELDKTRRQALEQSIITSQQTFITATDKAYFTDALVQQSSVVTLPISPESI